jgi:hypothetical protein
MEPRFRGSTSSVEAPLRLQHRLQPRSLRAPDRLAGFRVEPEPELLLEPCQTGPKSVHTSMMFLKCLSKESSSKFILHMYGLLFDMFRSLVMYNIHETSC